MNFTCNGTITHWRAAGRFRNRMDDTINPVLSIWRERSSELGTYDRVDTGIELGRCGDEEQAPSVIGMSNVYECNLTQSERVTVQPGDVIGIELPTRRDTRFRLNFDDNNGGPINYEFRGHDVDNVSSFTLSHSSFTSQDQPQISLTVVTTIPVLLTTLPLTITEVSTPDITTTQSPITITEASSTDLPTTQSLTTTEALSIAATHPYITNTVAIDAKTIQTSSMSTTESLPMTKTATQSLITMTNPNSVNLRQPNSDLRLIIGSVVGVIAGTILLPLPFAILILLVVYQSRKYKRYLGDRETRIDMAQNDNTINIETKANDSYVPVFCQISTEDNFAYDEIVNQDSNNINLYEIVDPSVIAITAQLTHKEHNREATTEDDYVNYVECLDVVCYEESQPGLFNHCRN